MFIERFKCAQNRSKHATCIRDPVNSYSSPGTRYISTIIIAHFTLMGEWGPCPSSRTCYEVIELIPTQEASEPAKRGFWKCRCVCCVARLDAVWGFVQLSGERPATGPSPDEQEQVRRGKIRPWFFQRNSRSGSFHFPDPHVLVSASRKRSWF